MFVLNPWFAQIRRDVELHQVYHQVSMSKYKYIPLASIIISGWWFQIFLFSPRKIGEDSHFWRSYFSTGWFNHQLDLLVSNVYACTISICFSCYVSTHGNRFNNSSSIMMTSPVKNNNISIHPRKTNILIGHRSSFMVVFSIVCCVFSVV